ncbi:hypothetical protein Cgig2_025243 [Carnegiea gigantea]|uniref:Uncharacterized protein n=1 Tax=Carnegiea gigantea TaxID=171969 RepID=A0A9Q1GVE5_9CARY|nr:hypothetical protein Cgig2_025243 [Carnegiea gigantea]
MWSKKRYEVRREGQRVMGHRKGFGVKGKGKVEEVKRRSTNDEREDAGRQQAVDMNIGHHCRWTQYALLQARNPESKCFKLGQREVPFSHFDVALLTGFPATGKRVAFERNDGDSEVEEVLNGAMEEREANNIIGRVALFKKLYTFLAIIPVIEVRDDERRIEAVEALIMSEDYSAYVEDGIMSMEERLRRARDALKKEREVLAKEKEAHAVMKKELAELKEAVAMKTTIDDILEFARI